MKTTKDYAFFDGMVWPRAGDDLDELAHRLTYGVEPVTKSDRLHAAAVLMAYQALVMGKTQKARNTVVKKLRQAELT